MYQQLLYLRKQTRFRGHKHTSANCRSAGTALAITFMTTGQHRFTVEHSKANPETLVAAGTQFTFSAIVIVAVIGLLLAFFVRRPTNQSH
ncbi:hypothetical protein ACQKNB_06715 [Lysinibacillus xylanilyticus]|uniref:hypothetical protein n=1 Tax=Lysinibacillus xylanilyticus TaxID=582475 RepID=UPI003CFF118A